MALSLPWASCIPEPPLVMVAICGPPCPSQKRSHYRSNNSMDLLLRRTLLCASSQGDGTQGFNVELCYGNAVLKNSRASVDGFLNV